MSLRYVDPARPAPLPLSPLGATFVIEDSGLEIRRSLLPGGVRLVTENLPGALSTSLGLWIAVGSRDEGPGEGGVSHFLEHLLFKGTSKRTAFDIGEAFDEVGAESNAATTKEYTYYWSHMVASDLPALLPVLTDMVADSTISDEDVEVERGVILDELAMSDDTPAEVVGEAFAKAVYGETDLGRPVGGTAQSVGEMSPEVIRDLYRRRYGPSELIVSAAGAVDHEELKDRLLDALSSTSWGDLLGEEREAKRRARHIGGNREEESFNRSVHLTRDIEQAHVVVGGQWLPALDPRGPVSAVTLNLLGGGVSSRLFQEIREKRGLAYTTYAFASTYSNTGHFGMYAGCAPKNMAEVEKVMWGELEKLAEQGPTPQELARARGQMRGGVTLNLEDSGSRMSRLARAEMVGEMVTVEDALARVDAVHAEDIKEMAAAMVAQDRSSAIVTSRG